MGRSVLKAFSLIFCLTAISFTCGCSSSDVTPSRPLPPAQTAAKERVASPAKGSGHAAVKAGPQIVTARFTPPFPRPGDEINLTVRTSDPDQSSVSFRYQWSVNEAQLADISGPSLKVPLKKGDLVSAVITPLKGTLEGKPVTRFTTVGNSPPVVKSSLANAVVTARRYTAKVIAEDPDEGDTLSYALRQAPAGMSIDAGTGEITWDFPDNITPGAYRISVSVKDNDGSEIVLNVPISVEVGMTRKRKT